ncbi:hypothetical protein D9M71_116920 [compost metagenome]
MNAGEQNAQDQARKQEKLARQQEINDFRWLMSDPRGRRLMWRVMGKCRLFQPSFDPHGGITNFNEGQRNVGLFLLSEINDVCPQRYAEMAAEHAPTPEERE